MIKGILTDIEGTTSSLSFVKDVLFPYARERIAGFVHCHAEDPQVVAHLNDVRLETGKPDMSVEAIGGQLQQWIDADRKVTPLKALQGMLWEQGYANGDFSGHVYDDAVSALRTWRAHGLQLYVFSSGSVQAQKLLFGYSTAGDLTALFSGYFDTRIGNKRDAAAYRAIAAQIKHAPADILFLSDVGAELDAAHAAGMQTCWLVREGRLDAAAAHHQVTDFSAVEV